jgi:cellulose synthase/poly-beta-1,6-N-acetylglucosamine synthase-like glycosyltransferase
MQRADAIPDFLSIGIAAYNEEESIERALEHIFKQSLWQKVPTDRKEIIICANGCTDRTVDIVRALQREHPEIKLIEIKEKSKVKAWKRIVKSVNPKAKIIFFTDADVIVHHKALERIWNAFRQEPKLYLVGGFAIPAVVEGTKDERMRRINEEYRKRVLEEKPGHLSGALYGINVEHAREIAKRMPDNILIEDRFIQLVTPRERYKKVFEAKVYFKPPQEMRDYLRERTRIAKGHRQLQKLGLEPRQSLWEEFKSKVRRSKGAPLKVKIYGVLAWVSAKIRTMMPAHDPWPKNVSSKIGGRKPKA